MSSLSKTNKVSLGAIIGNFIGNNGIENVSAMQDDLARWTFEAVKKIGSRSCYNKHECELEVKNFRACLPRGFVKLQAIKVKGKILDVSKKDFGQFYKGSNGTANVNESVQSVGSDVVAIDVPGVSQVTRILFTGSYLAGDVVTVTVVSNCEGNIVTNTYTYVVQPGDTILDVVAGVGAQITAIPNLPYTAIVSGQEITLTGIDPTVSFTVTTFTDSVNGSLEACLIQRNIRPKKRSPKQTSVKHPQTTSENLAQRRAFPMNTGASVEIGSNHVHYNYEFGHQHNVPVYNIINGYVHFNSMESGKCGISYWGVLLDEEGFPLVDDVHEDAVSHYLEYMYLKRRYNKGKLARGIFKDAESRWFDLCAQSRGDDELPDRPEMRYLANIWNQLLPLPTKNLF